MNHSLVRRKVKPWVARTWLVGVATVSALIVVAQAVERNTKKTTLPWLHQGHIQLDLAFLLALLTLAESIRRIVRRVTGATEAKMRREIRNQLGTAIASVCQFAPVLPGDLGCGLFIVRKKWRGPDQLVRVERLRLMDSITESGVTYTKGKGTVGKCWDQNVVSHHSWTKVNRRHHATRPGEAKWAKISEQARHGFSFDEWTTMLGRYAEVLAVPVTVGGTVIGCIALDRVWRKDDEDTEDHLKSDAVQAAVGGIARTLDQVLK